MLLKEEIKTKSSIILKQKKNLRLLGIVLKTPSHCLILHICLVCFLLIIKIKQVHYKRLHALRTDSSMGTHNPEKVICNYSSQKLSNVEKNVLVRSLIFALPPVKLN